MQEDPALAERLSVIGNVDQRRVDFAGPRLQGGDETGQYVIGVQQRVVVGVDDLLGGTLAQVVVGAFGLEACEGRRVPTEVRWPMVAELVQDDQAGPVRTSQALVETVQQTAVETTPTVAQPRRVQSGDGLGRQALTDPLATGLVVTPMHPDTGPRQHMQQRLAAIDPLGVVAPPAHRSEHARQRHVGVRPAARHLAEVDHVQSGEFRGRLPRVAVEPPVGRACRLADDNDDEARFAALLPAWAGRSVEAERLVRLRCPAGIACCDTGE
ncbi:MAG: hypothetical protein AW07_02944 [Candidatus Accumulibacter sp. SK-11]|nr:MAG: hypothetical protein AW07_02944 [Candidatus Accumulibacter sp. SK-11]